MLSKIEKVVDKDALEEIMENAFTDMEETVSSSIKGILRNFQGSFKNV